MSRARSSSICPKSRRLLAVASGQKKAQQLRLWILEAQLEASTPHILYKDHAYRKSKRMNLGAILNLGTIHCSSCALRSWSTSAAKSQCATWLLRGDEGGDSKPESVIDRICHPVEKLVGLTTLPTNWPRRPWPRRRLRNDAPALRDRSSETVAR